jgi:ribosome maturation factor RimP
VKVKTFAPVSDEKSHTGVLVSAGDDTFVVEVDGEKREITYRDVSSARTVFVWEKTQRKGKDA